MDLREWCAMSERLDATQYNSTKVMEALKMMGSRSLPGLLLLLRVHCTAAVLNDDEGWTQGGH